MPVKLAAPEGALTVALVMLVIGTAPPALVPLLYQPVVKPLPDATESRSKIGGMLMVDTAVVPCREPSLGVTSMVIALTPGPPAVF